MRVLAWPGPSYNHQPYIVQLYTHLQAQGVEIVNYKSVHLYREPFDVWHLHWPETRLTNPHPLKAGGRVGKLILEILLAKARGVKIIWTAHNLAQHERRHPQLEPWFWRAFTHLIDGWIALSPSGKDLAESRFPALKRKPSFVIPHGHFQEHYPKDMSREEARQHLGITPTAKVISNVGHVRDYKNIPHLIHTFRQLKDENLLLLIAGRPKTASLKEAILEAAGDDPRIRLRLEFIPDEDVTRYMRASDLVALPYTDILNSSSALLALTFGVPVLVPTRGAMEDLQLYAGTSWVQTFRGVLSPDDLQRAVAWSTQPRQPLNLNALDWGRLAEQTLRAYQTVCTYPTPHLPRPERAPIPATLESRRGITVRAPRLQRATQETHPQSTRERKSLQGQRP